MDRFSKYIPHLPAYAPEFFAAAFVSALWLVLFA